MSSVVLSPYRDRTAEFQSLTETLKKIGGVPAGVAPPTTTSTTASDPSMIQQQASAKSEFNKRASRIRSGIYEAEQKIGRLSKLAKKSSMFDDPTVEIQELTALIKNEITTLNSAVADLQTIQRMEITDGNYSEDRIVHTNAVCDDLKNRLMRATKQFQDVLTTRTESIRAHENRRQIFSASGSRQGPFQHQANPVTEPPPWSNLSNTPGSLPSTIVQANGVLTSNQLRRRSAVDNTPSHHMDMSMLQQMAPQEETYSQGRASALRNVESTITELSGIFTHLATMVAHQGELAIRIDDNMDESLSSVEGAHSALLRHLTRISSNRSLMIKIFAVLIFFSLVYIFLVA